MYILCYQPIAKNVAHKILSFFLYKKILHYQAIRIIEKQRNCQMWNSDVPPKPYRPS